MKTAAYLCTGCGIGDALDFGQLAKIAQKEGKMEVVRHHEFLCSTDGVQVIRDDIEKEGVTHVMIAACSRRAKTEAFCLPDVAVSRANLREGVLWAVASGAEHDEVRQEMADDYVRMGCAEVKKMKLPAGNPDAATNRRILVVGGGMSGLTAAIEAAETGYDVVVVEKSGTFGGWAAKLWKRVPYQAPYAEPQDTGLADLVARVTAHPRIRVHLNATIAETAVRRDGLRSRLRRSRAASSTRKSARSSRRPASRPTTSPSCPSSAAAQPNVVDQAGLETLAKTARGGCRSSAPTAGDVRSVVFVQCAGQRDDSGKHLPYCSGHCCATSIKQAMYFKDANPDVDTVVLYTDLRVPGMGEDFYRSAQKKGVTFTKGKASKVESAGSGCRVNFRDLILDEDATIDADLVVLATGQVPNSGVDIELPDEDATKTQQVSILNLNYRQGKDLPQLRHGFTDSHFICFPYETRRTGIYTAGPVRRPMDMHRRPRMPPAPR